MGARMSCRIDGAVIWAQIVVDTALAAPTLCFSLMAPARVVSGGRLARSLGGYGEVALPDLAPGAPHDLVIGYANADYRPVNRAWLPLGAYLRHAGGVTPLPPSPAGAAPWVFDGEDVESALRLVPPPSEWVPAGGTVKIAALAADHPALARADALSRRVGAGPLLSGDGVQTGVTLAGDHGEEGYRLTLAPDRIEVEASAATGVFYAGITLINLIATYGGDLPTGTITDRPRFEWRGQHLDCARHFYQPATLTDFLDRMALLKLNRFHWHFADDEAFRLELTCLPELWQKTRLRGEGHLLPGLFGGGIESGGSYSRAFARALIAHGKALNIEIMPEIEIPAHALAMNAALPGMRDPADTGTELSIQGYPANTLNPVMQRTWEVLGALIDEVAALFPFDYLHLGCDELPPGTWDESPAVDGLKQRERLNSADDVQGWMMAMLARDVVAQGKRPAAWEEAARGANGGIGNAALLFSWSGQGPGIAAARAGYDIVMSPAQHVYLDMAQSDAPDDWGAAWAAFVPLEQTVEWEPVPPELAGAEQRIKGVQGAFWSEFTCRDEELHAMIWPRLLGVAAKAWSEQRDMSGDEIANLARVYAPTPLARS